MADTLTQRVKSAPEGAIVPITEAEAFRLIDSLEIHQPTAWYEICAALKRDGEVLFMGRTIRVQSIYEIAMRNKGTPLCTYCHAKPATEHGREVHGNIVLEWDLCRGCLDDRKAMRDAEDAFRRLGITTGKPDAAG